MWNFIQCIVCSWSFQDPWMMYVLTHHRQDVIQGQFLCVQLVWILSFASLRLVTISIKKPSLPYSLPIAREKWVRFIPFSKGSIRLQQVFKSRLLIPWGFWVRQWISMNDVDLDAYLLIHNASYHISSWNITAKLVFYELSHFTVKDIFKSGVKIHCKKSNEIHFHIRQK